MSVVHTDPAETNARILSELISAMGSTRPDEILGRVVHLLARADGCRAAFAYRWNAATDLLELDSTAPLEQIGFGEKTYRRGEGVVGRAALEVGGPVTGTASIAGAPRGRARLAPVGERATAVAMRVATANGRLLGVIAVTLEGRATPSAATLRTMRDAASVLEFALEHGRLVTQSRREEELLTAIELIGRSVTGEASLAEAIASVASLGLRVGGAAACAIYVADRGQRDLRLAAGFPRDAAIPSVWRSEADGRTPAADPASHASTHSVPIVSGIERLGALVVWSREPNAPADDDIAAYQRLAAVAAIAMRQRRLLDGSIDRTRVEDLLWEVLGPGGADHAAVMSRAQRLGCDLSTPRVVIAAIAETAPVADRLRAAILAADRTAITDIGGDHVVAIASAAVLDRLPAATSAGVSQSCRELSRYPLAYRQAKEALTLGTRLYGAGHVVRFEDLGSYRFVPALIESGLTTEIEYRQVSKLSDDLLRTLEAYLDSGGNTALAAKQLFLHRNTLRQRLERISTSLDLDLTVPSRWLGLQLAIKTARMTRLAAAPPAAPTA